ncbi:MAG TPA: tetratricopeptide repeat protein [Steroidobacteraceae bacterium]|nr:tetratricopeptide repeat protein [Steroidobacteraceae bacterium]
MRSIGLTATSLLALLAACSGGGVSTPIPPPDEIAPRIEAVREAVRKNEAALKAPIEDHLDALENTIASIMQKHGDHSVEAVQVLQETSVLLAEKKRPDLALPFMERALTLSREVYGLDHRETAYPLHDVAVLLAMIAPDQYDPRAELLYRGAAEVRRHQAGVDDPETAASEAQLAWQLLLSATRESLPYRKYPLLAEAEQLALHAQRVFDAHKDRSSWYQIRRTLIETAFAHGDFAAVQERAGELLADRDYEKGPGLYPDATAKDLLAEAIELQAALLPEVEPPKARALQESSHEH